MKVRILFFVMFQCFLSYGQYERIVELNDQLVEYMNTQDDKNALRTALALKEEYKAKKITDTLTHLLLDTRLISLYNSTLQYKESKEIYKSWNNCISCEKDSLAGMFISILGSATTAYLTENNFVKALEINSKIIDLIQHIQDPNVQQLIGIYINERAELMMHLNDLVESERLYDLVILNTSSNTEQDLDNHLRALSGKSDLYARKYDFPKSIEYTYRMIEIYERNQDALLAYSSYQMGYCKSLLSLSQYFGQIADQQNALIFAEKLVKMSDKFNLDPFYRAMAYSQVGGGYFVLGDSSSGEKSFDYALTIIEQSYGKESPYLIQTLSEYSLYLSQQNFDKSISVAKRGIQISQSSKENFAGTEDLFSVISTVYTAPKFKRRNLDSALYYANLYQKISQKNHGENSVNYITSIDKIAKCYVLFDDFSKALPLQEDYKIRIRNYYGSDHSSYRYALNSLMLSYKYVDNLPKAEAYSLEIMNWWNNYIKKNYLSLVGTIHQNTQIIEAFDYQLYFVIDNLAKLSNSELLTALYDNQLLIKNLQLSTNASLRSEATKDPALMEKLSIYFDLQAQSPSAETQLQISKIEADLFSKSSAFKSLQEQKSATTQSVCSSLKQGEVAIEFLRFFDPVFADNSYAALVLRPNNPVPWITWLGTEDSIEQALKSLDFNKLYQYVWKHIPEIMPTDTKTIYISPVYSLNNVPFHALCQTIDTVKNTVSNHTNRGGEAENTSQTGECVYLMDQYDLHVVSSSRVLLERKDPLLTTTASILSVGGVDYNKVAEGVKSSSQNKDQGFYRSLDNVQRSSSRGNTSFDYLKGTELEVQEIGKLVKKAGWKETREMGAEASENIVKQELSKGTFEILHFATHGFSFPDQEEGSAYSSNEDPLDRCGLVLAGGNQSWTNSAQLTAMLDKYGEDGILTGKEVIEMPLGNTRLVVLSACKTGIGKIEGIEGSFSVNRAFLLAGVEYVISSLWSVPDKETMELMTLFYKELTKTNNIETSFATARLEMRKRYPNNPTAWAGFVLVR